jgi:hypothetical protein
VVFTIVVSVFVHGLTAGIAVQRATDPAADRPGG